VPEFKTLVGRTAPRQGSQVRTALILAGAGSALTTLESDLKGAGAHVLGASNCEQLVQDSMRLKPDVVVVFEPAIPAGLFAATALLESTHPVAVVVFTDDVRVETMGQALASGIHGWVVRGYSSERLRAELQLAQLRFAREKLQRDALIKLSSQLEERKLVDRAKGILMNTANMPEDQAFRVLRAAAMEGKERVGQVALRLIDAARNAEAINRAGQLRMLSQRLVKLHLLAALGVERHGAVALQRASVDRLVENLSVLADLVSTATFGDLLDACLAAWHALEPALAAAGRGHRLPDGLDELDRAAEQLLEAAERLTSALESAGPIARIQVVNVSGRQRMLSQRYAKFALLLSAADSPMDSASLLPRMAATRQEFDGAMTFLRQSPLTTAKAQAGLAAADLSWAIVHGAADASPLPHWRLAIARASEELLDIFDQLTERYEHSLQVLVGQ